MRRECDRGRWMLRVMHVTKALPLVTAEFVQMDVPPPAAASSKDVLAFGQQRATFRTACHGAGFTGYSIA